MNKNKFLKAIGGILIDLAIVAAISFVAISVVNTYSYTEYFVEGMSMYPLLMGDKQIGGGCYFGLEDTSKQAIDHIERFDIVSTYYNFDYDDYDQPYERNAPLLDTASLKIKRVIGLPGDTININNDYFSISFKDKNGNPKLYEFTTENCPFGRFGDANNQTLPYEGNFCWICAAPLPYDLNGIKCPNCKCCLKCGLTVSPHHHEDGEECDESYYCSRCGNTFEGHPESISCPSCGCCLVCGCQSIELEPPKTHTIEERVLRDFTLGEDEYFVMGDNWTRGASKDSCTTGTGTGHSAIYKECIHGVILNIQGAYSIESYKLCNNCGYHNAVDAVWCANGSCGSSDLTYSAELSKKSYFKQEVNLRRVWQKYIGSLDI